ncbi:citramalate synthase [Candidatus Bathyarchaeota archaeon]|nr:citramalate synthase [Candidatus Bathyarchaeota archaeon]
MIEKVEIYDTTLRDGNQAVGVNFSKSDKLKIAKRLDEIGVSSIEGGWPNVTNSSEIEFFREIKREDLKAEIVAFGRTRKPRVSPEEDEDLRILLEAEPDSIIIMGKSWPLHVFRVLETSLDENLRMIQDTVKYLVENGYKPMFDAEHFFDGFKEDKGYALKVLEAAAGAGASKLVLCDTRGASSPLEIYTITREVSRAFNLPIGIHAHNDRGLATANTLFAVLGGASQIQGTINGIGERCGNADLIEVVPNLEFTLDVRTGIDLKKLTQISDYIYEIANIPKDNYKPFVGRFAFSHKGGIHGHAVLKCPTAYEGLDPAIVGNVRNITVSSQAGISNLIAKAGEFGFKLEKGAAETRRILLKIKELEGKGYNFENANASLHLLIAEELGEDLNFFNLVNWRAYVLCDDGRVSAESTVKLRLGDKSLITGAEGNGPVNAFDKALRKALRRQYPELSKVRLVGYRVRELDVEEGTAAAVRVFAEFKAGDLRWSTIGVSSNILKASEEALIDGYRYYLYLEKVRRPGSESARPPSPPPAQF